MKYLKTPFLGTNDDIATLNNWLVEKDSWVKAGTIVANVETTKSVYDIEADLDGYLSPIVENGALVKPNQPIAIISEKSIENLEQAMTMLEDESSTKDERKSELRVTQKAQILMRRHRLSQKDLSGNHELIDEALVSTFIKKEITKISSIGVKNLQRVGIIGGVGGGGALIVAESLLCSTTQQPVCICDKNKDWHGKNILGIPVVGRIDKLFDMLTNREIDAVVIAFNRDLQERDALFNDLKKKEVPFCNVLDRNAELRTLVTVGTGNVILANAYLGACTTIGDNNFISANVVLEHGNRLGNSCSFGPGVFTSGNVTIEDRVKFGTNIGIEPNINIGSDAIISSGTTVVQSIDPKHVIKVNHNQKISLIE